MYKREKYLISKSNQTFSKNKIGNGLQNKYLKWHVHDNVQWIQWIKTF